MFDRESLLQMPFNRRRFLVLGVGAFAVSALPFGLRRKRELVRRTMPLMGTIAEIAVLHDDVQHAEAAIDAALAQLFWVDRTMTRFDASSDIGRANAMAGADAVRITPATAEALEEAVRWAEASGGAFDPCIGKATALWDVAERHEPPASDAVRRLAGRNFYRDLDIGKRGGDPVVRFQDPDVAIDLGGVAKGYGVDCAVEALRKRGIKQALVNVGGDLYAMGTSEDGDPWKVGIRSPFDPDGVVSTLEVSEGAVATSGDYLQFFEYKGRRYHHLLDPATGAPRESHTHSVTVTAARCVTADAAATTVFGMPQARAGQVLQAAAPEARVAYLV
jgi:thiamine biosynthesis lipoprotein